VIVKVDRKECLNSCRREIDTLKKVLQRASFKTGSRYAQVQQVLNRTNLCLISERRKLGHVIVIARFLCFSFERGDLLVKLFEIRARQAVWNEVFLENKQLFASVSDLVVEIVRTAVSRLNSLLQLGQLSLVECSLLLVNLDSCLEQALSAHELIYKLSFLLLQFLLHLDQTLLVVLFLRLETLDLV